MRLKLPLPVRSAGAGHGLGFGFSFKGKVSQPPSAQERACCAQTVPNRPQRQGTGARNYGIGHRMGNHSVDVDQNPKMFFFLFFASSAADSFAPVFRCASRFESAPAFCHICASVMVGLTSKLLLPQRA